jgi:hypothetical protein
VLELKNAARLLGDVGSEYGLVGGLAPALDVLLPVELLHEPRDDEDVLEVDLQVFST